MTAINPLFVSLFYKRIVRNYLTDNFSVDGAVSAGVRTANDGQWTIIGSGWSVASNKLAFPSAVGAWGTKGVVSQQNTNRGGMVFAGIITQSVTTGNSVMFGTARDGTLSNGTNSDNPLLMVKFATSGNLTIFWAYFYPYDGNYYTANAITVGTYSAATAYSVVIYHSGREIFLFIKGGAFTAWTLLFFTPDPSAGAGFALNTSPYVYGQIGANAIAPTVDNVRLQRIPISLVVPAYTAVSLTAGDTFNQPQADFVMVFQWNPTASNQVTTWYFRYVDANNYIRLTMTSDAGNTQKLYRMVAGVETLLSTATLYVYPDEKEWIQVVCIGTSFQLNSKFYSVLANTTIPSGSATLTKVFNGTGIINVKSYARTWASAALATVLDGVLA